jgi:hypothetical protein
MTVVPSHQKGNQASFSNTGIMKFTTATLVLLLFVPTCAAFSVNTRPALGMIRIRYSVDTGNGFEFWAHRLTIVEDLADKFCFPLHAVWFA